MNPIRHAAAAGLALLAVWGLAGCGGLPVTDRLAARMAAGDYETGLTLIEKSESQYAGPNSLLYHLDLGSFHQRAGNYAKSTQALEQAELLAEELYTKSVSEGLASFLVNDTTLSYAGEDFEQVMINVIKALNFLYQGDLEGAGVEARKVNTRLAQLADKYGDDAVYAEDAFARYLAAFAYEARGEYNDAYIDYKKALTGYERYRKHYGTPVPDFLARDLLRMSRWLGFTREYRRWRKRFPEAEAPSRRPRPRSEVLLVVYDGMINAKRTVYTRAAIKDADGDPYLLKVAFPAFAPSRPAVSRVRVGLPDGEARPAQVAQPLGAIAVKNLEQRIGLISAKAIARATAKYIAAVQARRATRSKNEGMNLLMNIATNVYTAATERADTRSWRTLPYRFLLIRSEVPPGEHTLPVAAEGPGGAARPGLEVRVCLEEGEKKAVPVYLPR